MNSPFRVISLILLVLPISFCLLAQEKDDQKGKENIKEKSSNAQIQYNLAVDAYDDGKIDSAKVILNSIANMGFVEKNLRGDIYLLHTKVNILRKDNDDALRTYKRFLALRPYYKPLNNDFQELTLMREKLDVKPRFTLEFEVGGSQTRANIQRSFNVFAANEGERFGKIYDRKIQPGISGMVNASWRPNRFLRIGFGLGVSTYRFAYHYRFINSDLFPYFNLFPQNPNKPDTIALDIYTLDRLYEHEQELLFLQIPIYLRFEPFNFKRISPFIELGAAYNQKMSAVKVITVTETNTYTYWEKDGAGIFQPDPPTSITQEELTVFDIGKINNNKMINAFGGVGVQFQFARLRFDFGVRQFIGLSQIVNQEERFHLNELVNGFYNLEDDYKINALQVYGRWVVPISFKAFNK